MRDDTIDIKAYVNDLVEKRKQKEKPVHLEDRISMLEKSAILEDKKDIQSNFITHNRRISKIENDNENRDMNLMDHTKRLSELEATKANQSAMNETQIDINDRLARRLESTEAQIRKLFALVDELKPKDNQVGCGPTNTIDRIDKRELERITVRGEMKTFYVNCLQCNANNHYDLEDSIRRVRMSAGHITEISYEWKCKCCKLPMIVTL